MIYRNDDYRAALAMEKMRTGYYGEDDYDDYDYDDYDDCGYDDIDENTRYLCPICGEMPVYFYINDDDECVGCSRCVSRSAAP